MEMIKYNYRRQSHLSFGSTTCNQRGKHSAITLPTSDIPSHPHLMASTSSQIFNDQLLRQYFTHLSVYAYKLKTLWFFFVTNIMLSFWVISLGSRNKDIIYAVFWIYCTSRIFLFRQIMTIIFIYISTHRLYPPASESYNSCHLGVSLGIARYAIQNVWLE